MNNSTKLMREIERIVRESDIPEAAKNSPNGFHLRRGARYLREAILNNLSEFNKERKSGLIRPTQTFKPQPETHYESLKSG